MLQIYNSLTREKAPFHPMESGKVKLYVCGMTVYDYCHLGHARVMVAFDIVVRYLRHLGYEVTYVRNITDVDDKIIKRAQENGETIEQLTERFIQAMHEDAAALGTLPPDIEPRATHSMAEIIKMVEQLVGNGFAYAADNGDVYYDVSKFKTYGALSGKKPEQLRSGARVEIGESKDDPLDFTLWKAVKPGEPGWDSPWGSGRPGWHIECSAMSTDCLGNHFDIHGGGQDLQFPHHENEIAQSEAATGEKFVDLWMHNGFVRINEEKMSKSLGNFFTVREILERYRPEEVRYFILTSQYRSPLNYSDQQLDLARSALTRFYTALRGLDLSVDAEGMGRDYVRRFHEAMDDDFNTPEALAVMFDLVREINTLRETDLTQATQLAVVLQQLAGLLGLLKDDPDTFLQGAEPGEATSGIPAEEIESLISQRNEARASKNWGEADRIRDLLKEQGVVLEDAGGNTSWRRE